MQSKGKLGSIVAGLIAICLVLVCLFYLSFTFISNKYENQAAQYALVESGDNDDAAYNQAYKHYMDSLGDKKVYMGAYTLNDVRKWGVGLGLDLKGGMNVILQVDMPDMLRSMKSGDTDSTFEAALAGANQMVATHQSDDFVSSFINLYRQAKPQADFSVLFQDIVSAGASDDAVRSTLKAQVKDRVDNSATNVLRNRIDQFGVVSPNIQVLQGKDGQILLELPGVKDHERVRDLLQRSANLEFYETYRAEELGNSFNSLINALAADTTVNSAPLVALLSQGAGYGATLGYAADAKAMAAIDAVLATPQAKNLLPADLRLRWAVKPSVRTDADGKEYNFGFALYALRANGGKAALDGKAVSDASSNYDPLRGNEVSMRMNAEGARNWARITGQNVGKQVAIVLDDKVYSAPNVNGKIDGGQSSITGDFTIEEARDLANVLKSGKMDAKVHIISDMVVGPSLGAQAIKDGFISFVVALVLLMIFMITFYGVIPGLVANICLICNLFFTVGILASFQAVLTMSGIAGIVLSLGMAVDANVLIFERTKEELRAGKTVRNALADGYSNAFSAIFDSNLTSIITGVILLIFGTGPIKGFATTLIIGLICSFFTAVYLSRLFFLWFSKTEAFNKLTFATSASKKMFLNTNINFLGQRKISFAVVAVMVVIVVISLFARGLNQGIDFSGGRNYIVKFEQPVQTTELQEVLAPQFPGASTSVITIESSNQVRVSTNYKITDEDANTEKEITDKLFEALKPYLRQGMTAAEFSTTDASQGIVSSQKVGPSVADDMRTDAYIAVAIALVAMFFYILLRFRNVAFSLGALAAVAFTAFTIVGFYSIFYGFLPFAMEVDQTFIAAVLTVIGYQINDTVVVFDRVRENMTLYPKQDFYTTVNKSINTTLSRTIMTSVSTLLVLVCIFILGGDAIRSFTFAMLFGVIIGTLATIYVACPVAYLTDSKKNKKAAVEK
ncbi:MAG: protein translocase subunit SecD [Bacteroidales bacterium]|nr:protein translocase subunit SecD [Bacteroidales bacterium]MBD5219915.1 protein translocase subunit SecD [Bacteroidales bacterium]